MSLAQSIAITGASGFVGQYASRWLAGRGHRIIAVSRSGLSPAGAGVEVRMVPDEASAAAFREAFTGADAVLHLAGRAHVMEESSRDPAADYRAANVDATRRALEGAAGAGCRTFVFASSVKAVGERTSVPWTEETPPRPVEAYGISKLEAEQVVHEGGARLGIRTVSIRFPAIYGPGMRANMLRLFSAVARGLPLPLGSIPNRRSFLYVGNAAAVLELAIARMDAGSGLYFVSDGRDVSTPELVRAIARAVGRRARLVPVPPMLFRLVGRIGDRLPPWLPWAVTSVRIERLMGSLQVDPSRVRAELGFVPPYSLDQGMRETAAWYSKQGP